jgi:hypothetical protein
MDILEHEFSSSMTKQQIMEARLVEFTEEFLMKHCKE